MTSPSTSLPDLDLPRQMTPDERAAIDAFEDQRRLNLLRILVPGFLVLSLLGVPAAVRADIQGALAPQTLTNGSAPLGFHFYGTLQTSLAFVGYVIALYGLVKRRVWVAVTGFFAAISLNILFLIVTDSFLPGPLALRSLGDFALLVLPIVLAGLLGGSRLIIGTVLVTIGITLADFFLAGHDTFLVATLAQSDGIAVIIIPIALQVACGVIIFAASFGLRRTQRELNSVRLAFARERELDRLKDRFISNVNHELRTPIMSLQGYLTIARELGNRGDLARQAQILERGMQALGNLSALVESVLKVRQLEADGGTVPLAPVPLRDALDKAILLLDPRETGEMERALRLEVAPTIAVMAHSEKLMQVLLNLLSNACKYSSPGTPIDVRARVVQATDRGAEPQVQVTVRDYGLGIPPDQIPLLFGRFVRLDRDLASNVVGTGLGLAITKSTVEAMGGTIRVESTGVEGDGSAFIFTLPLAQVPAPTA